MLVNMINIKHTIKSNFTRISFYLIFIVGVIAWLNTCDLFWLLAVIWSGFLGSFAYKIHTNENYENQSWPKIIHQFIFNFGSAIIGWVIVYNLIPIDIKSVNEAQVILLIIAGISFTGYLPKVITLFKN